MGSASSTEIVNSDPPAEELNPVARRFLTRLTVVTAGGMFIDGYLFAVVAVTLALQTFKDDLGITPLWSGLISSATLIGIFVGGFIFGWLTDRYGRRPLFMVDLGFFAVASVLLFFVQESWQMFGLGLVMGMAIGADYAIGQPLLCEFSPARVRGRLGSTLQLAWNVGYMVAFAAGYLITVSYPNAWRWVLLSAVIPTVVCLVARHGLPESPRWLLSKGRDAEAEKVLERLGWTLDSADFEAEPHERTRPSALFAPGQLGRTMFVCLFWTCLIVPYFAIIFFQADVYSAVGVSDPLFTALLGTVVVVAGVLTGTLLVDRVGRRKLLITSFWSTAAALSVVVFAAVLPSSVVVVCFFFYLFTYGVGSILCGVYPMELFPTSIRTTGVGFATSVTRVGTAIGTFAFPLVLAQNAAAAMAIMAGVCVIGAVASQLWAPETRNRSLTDVSHGKLGQR